MSPFLNLNTPHKFGMEERAGGEISKRILFWVNEWMMISLVNLYLVYINSGMEHILILLTSITICYYKKC